MLLAIIGALAAAVYTGIRAFDDYSRYWDLADYVAAVVQPLLALVATFLVLLLVLFLVGLCFRKHWVRESTTSLVTLRGAEGAQGSFFLGCGAVGTTEFYFYYAPTADGGFRPGRLSINDDVVIYEEERQDGELITHVRYFVCEALDVFLFQGWPQRYEFRIPKGSLKRGYSL